MQVLLDDSVMDARQYYKTYLREPSPAGDISFTSSDISTVKAGDMDLEQVLTQMKSIPAPPPESGTGREILVVTHSDPKGFKMPIMKGGQTSVIFNVMDIMPKIQEGIDRREAIRTMPAARVPRAWQDWFKDFESGVKLESGFETNDKWQEYVEKKYNEWYTRQGTTILKLPNPGTNLKKILDLLKDVKALNFARMEFRACRLGTSTDSLKKVATFFNAKKVVAPKEVRTFYGVTTLEVLADAKKYAAQLKGLGKIRMFPGIDLGMQIHEKTFRAITTDPDQAKAFIKQFISSGYAGGVAPFVIGGLEPTGANLKIVGKPQVFPLESEYKTLLESLDLTAAAPPTP
jgi:hypothetical protein